jgi:hypothetical protein
VRKSRRIRRRLSQGLYLYIYDKDQEYKAVDYSGLTGVLIEAVKELKAQNEALRLRIEALERTQQ